MRLRLEMDALPRLFDMLLFVLRRLLIFGAANLSDFMCDIFFYASIDYRSFACSLKGRRAENKRAVRLLG